MKYNEKKLSDREVGDASVAGPWLGEFGWEIMKWQPGIRGYAEKFPDRYLVVISEPGHHLLYEKADEFWSIPDEWLKKMDTEDFVRETSRLLPRNNSGEELQQFKKTLADARDKQIEERFGSAIDTNFSYRRTGKWKEFVKLEADYTTPDEDYFVVAPRQRPLNKYKNYPKGSWEEIVGRVGSQLKLSWKAIGRIHEVRMLQPDFDIRKEDKLRRSIGLLNGAKFAIVPESGAGFLTLLCGCPTIIFSHEKWRERYTNKENPLDTPIEFIGSPNRSYSVDGIVERTITWITS